MYAAFGSHCDRPEYWPWIFAFEAQSLKIRTFWTTPSFICEPPLRISWLSLLPAVLSCKHLPHAGPPHIPAVLLCPALGSEYDSAEKEWIYLQHT